MTDQRQPRNESHYHKTWDWAALLGSLTLLLSAQVPLSNEVYYFVSMCVSSDSSFLSATQQPTLRPWTSGKGSTCQRRRCRRHGFDPWVRKIPWRRKWQTAPAFLPGKSQSVCLQRVGQDWGQTQTHTQQILGTQKIHVSKWKALLRKILLNQLQGNVNV